jgi:hypothetical protein
MNTMTNPWAESREADCTGSPDPQQAHEGDLGAVDLALRCRGGCGASTQQGPVRRLANAPSA